MTQPLTEHEKKLLEMFPTRQIPRNFTKEQKRLLNQIKRVAKNVGLTLPIYLSIKGFEMTDIPITRDKVVKEDKPRKEHLQKEEELLKEKQRIETIRLKYKERVEKARKEKEERDRARKELEALIKSQLSDLYPRGTVYDLAIIDNVLYHTIRTAKREGDYTSMEDYLFYLGYRMSTNKTLSALLRELDSFRVVHGITLDCDSSFAKRLNKYLTSMNMSLNKFQRIYKHKLYSRITLQSLEGFTEEMLVDLLQGIYPQKIIEDKTWILQVISRYAKKIQPFTNSFVFEDWLGSHGFKSPFQKEIEDLFSNIESICIHRIILDVPPFDTRYHAILEASPLDTKTIERWLRKHRYTRYSAITSSSLEGFTENMVVDLLQGLFPQHIIEQPHQISHAIPKYVKNLVQPSQTFIFEDWLKSKGFNYRSEMVMSKLLRDIEALSVHQIIIDTEPYKHTYNEMLGLIPYEDSEVDAYFKKHNYTRYSKLRMPALRGFSEDMIADILHKVFPDKCITDENMIALVLPRYLKKLIAPEKRFNFQDWLVSKGFNLDNFKRREREQTDVERLLSAADSLATHNIIFDIEHHLDSYMQLMMGTPIEDDLAYKYLKRNKYHLYSELHSTTVKYFTEDMLVDILRQVFPNNIVHDKSLIINAIPRRLSKIFEGSDFNLDDWLVSKGFKL